MDNYKDLLKSYTAKSSRSTKAIEDYYNRYKKPTTPYSNTRMKPLSRADYYRTNNMAVRTAKKPKSNIKNKKIANK